jgi:hypothetical protein
MVNLFMLEHSKCHGQYTINFYDLHIVVFSSRSRENIVKIKLLKWDISLFILFFSLFFEIWRKQHKGRL